MAETPLSLLDRLRNNPEPSDWPRWLSLYSPFIRSFVARHCRLQPADVEDLVQNVCSVVVAELRSFQHRGPRTFRGWLWVITLNRLREFWRSRDQTAGVADGMAILDGLADENTPLGRLWDQEHDQHVIRRLLEMIEPDFEPETWKAFRRYVIDEQPVAVVAAELGISMDKVYVAKSRVLNKLKTLAAGFLD